MKTRLTSMAFPRIVFWLLAVFLVAKQLTASAALLVTVVAAGNVSFTVTNVVNANMLRRFFRLGLLQNI